MQNGSVSSLQTSGEPLNADPDLLSIIAENRHINQSLSPLFTFTPWSHPTSLLPAISRCELGRFHRHAESEQVYRVKFKDAVERKYGPMSTYLRDRLGWDTAVDTVARGKETESDYFTADDEEGSDFKVAPNEWAYALPSDVAHICVWTRRPLLHRSLAASPAEWKAVSKHGLSGFTGLPPDLQASLPPDNQAPTSSAEAEGTCAREIARYVERRWRREDGWTTAYFVNPPALQSIRGLSHFHVFAVQHQQP